MAHDSAHDYAEDRVPAELLQQIGYETRDVGPAAILRWIAGLFVFIGIVTVGIVLLENAFIPETGRIAYESEIYRTQPVRHPPLQPQLQTLPKRDMIMFRKDENRVLNGYANTKEGRVSIPVEQAMDQMASEGISGVSGGSAAPAQDRYPGYYSTHPQEATGETTETKSPEAPTTQDGAEAGVAAPQPSRATDSLTEERKNVPANAEGERR